MIDRERRDLERLFEVADTLVRAAWSTMMTSSDPDMRWKARRIYERFRSDAEVNYA